MQVFRYRAARADGSIVRGRVEAIDGAQASSVLAGRGLHPVAVEQATDDGVRRGASRRDLAVVFRSIAALVTAGVPLERAIASSEAVAKGSLRDCLVSCRLELRSGHSLAQGLAAGRGLVPPIVLGMLRAGEHAGRLGPALEQVATQMEQEAELSGRIRQALAYPALLLVAGLASIGVIAGLVVPRFAALLSEMGQDLPTATRVLLAASAVTTGYGVGLLACGGLAGWLFVEWIRRPDGELWWHRSLLSLPGVGSLRQGLATARFSRALGGALQAGMPLLAAVEISAEAAGDRAVGDRLSRSRDRVSQGEPLSSALAREEAVSATALQLYIVGEQSGQLAAMATRAGDLAAQDTQRHLLTLVSLLEPALVVTLGGFVAFTAAALLQAVYSLRPAGL